ncbi:MAG: 3-oxoacyl-ACP reductase FabG [Myxococcaceae bacterium]
MRCKNRVALVTGASRGIGRGIALKLAEEGASLILNYHHNEIAIIETAEAIQKSTGQIAKILRFDVGNPTEVQAALSNLKIDILVNNAGISRDGLLMRAKDTDWQIMMATNLSGAFYCSRACSRHMIKQYWGRIINLSSVVGEIGNAGQAAYATSKAGLLGLTKSLARELASRQITVNAIAPGLIKTDMTAGLEMSDEIPLGFAGEPEDIAHAAAFLASEQARYITGHTLDINGGLYMH